MRRNRSVVLCVACVFVVGWIAACSVNVTTDDGGTTVAFSIAGVTVSISLGSDGSFNVVADGPPVQKTVGVKLFDKTPDDQPVGATLILPASSVTFIPEGSTAKRSAKIRQEAPELLCLMDVYMADTSVANPCEDGVYVGTYEIMIFGDASLFVKESEQRISDSLMDSVRAGLFNLCMRVTGKQTGNVIIDEMQIRFDDAVIGGNTDGNTDGNTNNDDGSSSDGNSDDNSGGNSDDGDTSDGTDDNPDDNMNGGDDGDGGDTGDVDGDGDDTDPVNPLDPDGDGNFEAQVCDSHTSIEVSAEAPPRYSGSEGNVACLSKIHFKNTSSRNVVIWWHIHKEVPSTGNVTEDGWYSTGLDPGTEIDSIDSAWIYSEQNDTLLHVVTDQVMVTRYDNEYADGCRWLSNAIREDASAIDLTRIEVADLNPCE